MATYIQVNIYNQTLDTLKMRGIDLAKILRSIDCQDTWISEVPILPPKPSFVSSEALELTSPIKRITSGVPEKPETLKTLFDDWDPVFNLPTGATPSSAPEDPVFKTPKEEPLDEPVEMNDSELANQEEQRIIQDLLSQKAEPVGQNLNVTKSRRQMMSDDPEIASTLYSISCCYPGCSHQYNWRVKYGKLRLLDHALSHSNRTIPCKLCGFEVANVRRMRSHYAKDHPTEKVEGYGMKALVSGDAEVAEEELKELWIKCYAPWIGLIGEACGSEGYRKNRKRRIEEDVEFGKEHRN